MLHNVVHLFCLSQTIAHSAVDMSVCNKYCINTDIIKLTRFKITTLQLLCTERLSAQMSHFDSKKNVYKNAAIAQRRKAFEKTSRKTATGECRWASVYIVCESSKAELKCYSSLLTVLAGACWMQTKSVPDPPYLSTMEQLYKYLRGSSGFDSYLLSRMSSHVFLSYQHLSPVVTNRCYRGRK